MARMKLITKAIERRLEKTPFNSTRELPVRDKPVLVKFFNPIGDETLYVFEAERGDDGDWTFFGAQKYGDEWSCIFWTLADLKAVRLPMGLSIERDKCLMNFTTTLADGFGEKPPKKFMEMLTDIDDGPVEGRRLGNAVLHPIEVVRFPNGFIVELFDRDQFLSSGCGGYDKGRRLVICDGCNDECTGAVSVDASADCAYCADCVKTHADSPAEYFQTPEYLSATQRYQEAS